MNLLTGLFMAAKRRLMTTDSNSDSFKAKLDELIEKKIVYQRKISELELMS